MGADASIDSDDKVFVKSVQNLAHNGGGHGVAATLDLVRLPQTMNFGLSLLRKGGHHVHVGFFGGAYPISLPPLAFRMLRISRSYVGTLEEFRELVGLVQNGMDLSIPITARPLEQADKALGKLQAGKVVGRLMLKPCI